MAARQFRKIASARIIIPIMDYLSQNVGVSPLRQRIKKAAPNKFASVSYRKISTRPAPATTSGRSTNTPRMVGLALRELGARKNP